MRVTARLTNKIGYWRQLLVEVKDISMKFTINASIIATSAVVGTAAPLVAQDGPEPGFCGELYVIQTGDTLSQLSERAFGDFNDFLRFYDDDRNRESLGANPNRISVGTTLYLPPCPGAPVTLAAAAPTATQADAPPAAARSQSAPTAIPAIAGMIDVVTASDFAPFTDEGLTNGGMLTTLVAEAFDTAPLQQDAEIVFINDWGSQLETLLPDLKYDFSFPWYRPDCSDPSALSDSMRIRCDLVWSDPLFSVIIGFYALATLQDEPASFAALQGKRLCRPAGYFTFDLEEQGLIPGETIELSQPVGVSDCFELLENGDVDFVTINRFTAEKAIAQADLDGLIKPIQTVVTTQDLHLVGHQYNPDAVRLIEGFNTGLRQLREQGRATDITRYFMQRHQEELVALRTN